MTHRIPSVKTMCDRLKIGSDAAKTIYALMERFHITSPIGTRPTVTLEKIDAILGTHGVEFIEAGSGSRSPSITYCNTGDTYDQTVLWVNGRFQIGCWGDIVERGNYA